MFRRLFWFSAGLTAGVWGTMKVNRAVRRLTPGGLAVTAAERAIELGGRARRFAVEVRAGMAEREAELGDALGLAPARPGRPPAPPLPGPRREPAARPYPDDRSGRSGRGDQDGQNNQNNRKEDH